MNKNLPEYEERFFALFEPYIDLERNTGRKYTEEEYSLDGVNKLAELAGHPEKGQKIIHVAGTKGKGSTVAFLSSLLASAGFQAGAFTSPHLVTVRERFLLNGMPVAYELLLEEARSLLKAVRKSALDPTFFELMTILGLLIFKRAECDWIILEAGIGGRLDCTNFIPSPACAVITSISLDHTALLGENVAEIATEKAGIIKPKAPVVCGPQPFPEAFHVVQEKAEQCGCRFMPVKTLNPAALYPWGLQSAPRFMQENMQTALTVCDVLQVEPSPERFRVRWPRGRCEVVSESPLVIIDAAHNADSARRLAEAVIEGWSKESFTVVLGVVDGKDVRGIVEGLKPLVANGRLVLTNPRSPKASGLHKLLQAVREAGLTCQVCEEINFVNDLPQSDAYLFAGSFFTATIGDEIFNQKS